MTAVLLRCSLSCEKLFWEQPIVLRIHVAASPYSHCDFLLAHINPEFAPAFFSSQRWRRSKKSWRRHKRQRRRYSETQKGIIVNMTWADAGFLLRYYLCFWRERYLGFVFNGSWGPFFFFFFAEGIFLRTGCRVIGCVCAWAMWCKS